MAKKSDCSLFINFFFNSLKKIGLFIIFKPSIFTIRYFIGSLLTIHYKKGPLFTNHYIPSRPSCMCESGVTTPASLLANEFDVRSVLHGQVSLTGVNQICIIHEAMNGCKTLKLHLRIALKIYVNIAE